MIDPISVTTVALLGKELKRLFEKPGAEAIFTKIATLKNEKDTKELRSQYEAMIFDLLEDKQKALAVAGDLELELKKTNITDEEIDSLQVTITSVLDIMRKIDPGDEEALEAINLFKDLISSDTLRTMQLLGFNYKKAIGESLTDIADGWIREKLSPPRTKQSNRR